MRQKDLQPSYNKIVDVLFPRYREKLSSIKVGVVNTKEFDAIVGRNSILFSRDILRKRSEIYIEATIAHEICHILTKHVGHNQWFLRKLYESARRSQKKGMFDLGDEIFEDVSLLVQDIKKIRKEDCIFEFALIKLVRKNPDASIFEALDAAAKAYGMKVDDFKKVMEPSSANYFLQKAKTHMLEGKVKKELKYAMVKKRELWKFITKNNKD